MSRFSLERRLVADSGRLCGFRQEWVRVKVEERPATVPTNSSSAPSARMDFAWISKALASKPPGRTEAAKDECPVRNRVAELERTRGDMRRFNTGDWLELCELSASNSTASASVLRTRPATSPKALAIWRAHSRILR